MDANLILGSITAGIAVTYGVWGLVLYRRNGNGKNGHPAPPPVEITPRELTVRGLDALPGKIEQGLAPAFEGLVSCISHQVDRMIEVRMEPEVPPGWATQMSQDLEHIREQLSQPIPPPTWPPEMVPLFERLVERLDALQQPPVVLEPAPSAAFAELALAELDKLAVPLTQLPGQLEGAFERFSKRIEDLIEQDVFRKREAAKPESTKDTSARDTGAPGTQSSPTLAPPAPRQSKPITRQAEPIVLEEFNTITMAEFTVYELHPLEEGVFQANVLNLGPGWLYMRETAEPTIGDPEATTLPPGAIDNQIRVAQRLYVLASEDGSITVRLMH